MARKIRCTIDSGWVGSKHKWYVEPVAPGPHSIMIEQPDDVKLLDYIQDGEWWSLWKRENIGFTRKK